MGWPVVTVASGGIPVTTATNGYGTPITEAANGLGIAVTFVASGGLPVVGGGGVLPGTLNAAKGTFSLTGNAANLIKTVAGAYIIAADTGAFVLTGDPMTPLVFYYMGAAQGSFTSTGQSAGMLKASLVTAAAGSFAMTGVAATLTKATPSVSTTWNPADKNSNITLSGGNLIATPAAIGNFQALRSVSSQSTGKYYWEITVGTITTPGGNYIGIANGSFALTDGSYVGSGTNVSAGWGDGSGNLITNGGFLASMNGVTYGSGDTICFALDKDNGKLWARKGSGQWMGTTDNPATNTGGASISAITGAIFAASTLFDVGCPHTANFGGSAFAFTPPAGFGNL